MIAPPRMLVRLAIALILAALAAVTRQRRRRLNAARSLVLERWLCTEYTWPNRQDHERGLHEKEVAKTSDATAPAYVAFRDNAAFLKSHGARLLEGVDGYAAAQALHHDLHIKPSDFLW